MVHSDSTLLHKPSRRIIVCPRVATKGTLSKASVYVTDEILLGSGA